MARRVVKPFAVEVRRGGRKAKEVPAPSRQEQPEATSRPDADQGPADAGSLLTSEMPGLATVVPTRRILPALDEPATPAPAKKPRGRKPQAAVAPVDDAAEDPKLDEVMELELTAPAANHQIAAATLPLRKGRTKLPREAFRPGDRWKARLPTAVHRSGKRRGS